LQAKGYPDLSTRRFLRAICDHPTWLHRPRTAIFGLFDADPDGVNIMQIYRQGSHSLPHERAADVPEMQWLGIRTDDVLAEVQDDEAVLKLTARDRRKAVAMLDRLSGEAEAGVAGEQCRIELQKMLMLNVKAEIQILEDRPGGVHGWLDQKIRKQLSRTVV
jgi:meiotic recombination protein SPO11